MSHVIPEWAIKDVYEYDLGMSTSCHVCGKRLKEGQDVWRDDWELSPQLVAQYEANPNCEFMRRGTDYYCSEDCVAIADGIE